MARRKQAPGGKATAAKAAPAPAHDDSLYEFAVDFFTLFGAQVRAGGGRGARALEVDLPPDLAGHFGREHLALCFPGREPESGQELVAHGSRAFDRMLALLEQRSVFSVQRLPQRTNGGDELLRAVQPANAAIQEMRLQEQMRWLFVFTWRITYRADDKRQELYTVVVDDSGARIPLLGEPNAPADALDIAALLAEAAPPPPEHNEEGHLLPPKLPPLTQLTRLAESARRYAVYHADVRCVSHEAEILPRLHKALNRLTSYYQQQIEEVYDAHDPDGTKRRALELDLDRKIAEEVENHRLHVDVELVSYLAVETPIAVLEMTLSDGKRQAVVRAVQERYNGAIERPACHSCGAETTSVVIDRSGHVICDNCIEQCATCREIVCARCGAEPCPVCGAVNCTDCAHVCAACGGHACPQHSSRCPVCGDEVCHNCQSACSACGVLQCRSHLQADNQLGATGEVQLICAACAVRCPGCKQYTAHLGTCEASGQRFCHTCLVECTICGRQVGPGFYTVSPIDKLPYCSTCRQPCPTCGTVTPTLVACKTCGAEGCPRCTPFCAACGEPVCAKHGHVVQSCGHVLCDADVGKCHIDGAPVCLACSPPCAICGQPYCSHHAQVCLLCGQEYCERCFNSSGRCRTCASISLDLSNFEVRNLRDRPWAKAPEVAAVVGNYRWTRASNERFIVFYGQGSLLNAAVIVVRKASRDARTGEERPEQVVLVQKISAADRLRGFFGA